MSDTILELRNITKVFPDLETPVIANDRVSFKLRRGEIHAIVGENGAGKTTLMNILYGLLTPDEGEIYLNGERVQLKNPRDAIARGIGMVHQHFMLIPSFTVAENLVFTFEPTKNRYFVDKERAVEITRQISERYGLHVDPHQKIAECPLSMRQRVEILKILFQGANILIFDEPTAVLTPQEADELFSAFRELKRDGKSIIFITHKLREVMAVADRVTVIRKGQVVDVAAVKDCTIESLSEKMVGRKVDIHGRKVDSAELTADPKRETILEVRNLVTEHSRTGVALQDISFIVKAGDIVGVAGVGGNGQDELVECITGLDKIIKNGKIFYRGLDITSYNAHQIRELGIAYITGERYVRGISANSSVYDNLIMGAHRRSPWAGRLFMSLKRLRELADHLIEKYNIKASSRNTHIMNLSGGNIQKCILARELNLAKDLIVAEEPTRGVDVGSIEFIHNQLIEKSKEGYGIILVSTDLDEILSLSTKIIVMYRGRIIGTVDPETVADRKEIGLLMAGIPAGEGSETA
ncbi:MAG TPA: ABC transporter ATP-binding protein [Limnochordia bacterium]|nr:ABC transporter ATP-binding protein [Limnochordia bacterium]